MAQIAEARGYKKFTDLADFASRIDPKSATRGHLEILAKAGAFDSVIPNRAQVFALAETLSRRAQSHAEEQESGQTGLFGSTGPEPIRLPDIPDWNQTDRLIFEAEAIGFHISAHPLDMYATALKRLGVVSSAAIERWAQTGSRIKLAGTVTAKKERITRTGSRMMWVTLSDMEGSYEVTFFSEILLRSRELLSEGTALLVTADVKIENEALRITAQDVTLLDEAASKAGASLRIWLDRTEALPHIRALLEREGKGRGRVTLVPKMGLERNIDVILPHTFNISPKLAQAMKMVPGVEMVEDV
jgi:DNA polymerase-3 subunit alpha